MEPFRPSAFTPFLRRFTDERARDLSELRSLYRQVQALHYASPYSGERAVYEIGSDLYGKCAALFPDDVLAPIAGLMSEITRLERPIFEFPDIPWDIAHLTLKEQVDLNRFLTAKQYFHAHEERLIAEFKEGLERIFEVLTFGLPQMLGPSPFNVPMMNALSEPRLLIDRLYSIVCDEKYMNLGLFAELRERTYANLCQASNVVPHSDHRRSLKHAMDRDDPLAELVDIYLAGTPFPTYLNAPIPLKLTYEDRFSHMHVVGGSGAGKTQLLQHLILHDLQSDDPPALVIVDSQTDLINKLSHLALFDPHDGPLADRLLIITPRDIPYPPALNIFDVNRERLGQYDEGTKEQVTAGVIQTFDYLFNGLLGADLTAKQGVFFRFVARLMLALPETLGRNATILDLIALMDDAAPYRKAIESLPPIQRAFFERDFPSKTFAQTKEQIRYRLNAILENPILARLFTSPRTKIDLFTALNNNAIILVDTAKDLQQNPPYCFNRGGRFGQRSSSCDTRRSFRFSSLGRRNRADGCWPVSHRSRRRARAPPLSASAYRGTVRPRLPPLCLPLQRSCPGRRQLPCRHRHRRLRHPAHLRSRQADVARLFSPTAPGRIRRLGHGQWHAHHRYRGRVCRPLRPRRPQGI